MRRFALIAMPIFTAITAVIGIYFGYVGLRMAAAGKYVALGLGFAAFGAVGLILAYALWDVRRQILLRMTDGEGRTESG